MWYRCVKHGSYNVDSNTPHFLVSCPSCEREDEERPRRRRKRGCDFYTRRQWQEFCESLPSIP